MKIHLVTYNTLFCFNQVTYKTLASLCAISNKNTNSFVALQEVRNALPNEHLEDEIQTIFSKYYSSTYISATPSLHDLGLMTLSSMQILHCVRVPLPKVNKHVLNPQVYFLKNMPQHGALITQYKIGNKTLRVTNIHLDVMGGLHHKIKQIQHIQKFWKNQYSDYDIICGDFNTIGISPMMNAYISYQKNGILKTLGYPFKEVCIDTWTSDVSETLSPLTPFHATLSKVFSLLHVHFRQKLDWVFVRGFRQAKAVVWLDLVGSDHYPIVATLST